MSGFEIAGITLAVFPLLISALEQYKEVNRMRDYFMKRSLHVEQLINALTEQRILIEGDLELVLRAAGFDESDVGNLIAGQYLSLLSTRSFTQEMETLLGNRCQQYVKTLGRCEQNLFDIARSLSNFKPGPWVQTRKLSDMLAATQNPGEREVLKRLKFSMRREDLNRKIAELDSCTRMLRRLGELGMSIHEQIALTTSRKSAKLVRLLTQVRNRALILYNAVSPKWALTCHRNHSTELILKDRLELSPNRLSKNASASPTEFEMLLRAAGPKTKGKILWHDADINVLEPDLSAPLVSTSPSPSTSGVRFNVPAPAHPLKPSGQEVNDLCNCVEGAERQQKLLKLIVTSEAKLYSMHLSLADRTRRSRTANLDIVGLEDILSSKSSPVFPKLKLMRRARLAFVLASSLIQLHATPWVGKHLSKSSVFFFVTKSPEFVIDVDYPALSCAFPNATTNNHNSRPNAESSLLELGILIMELWHHQTIEDYFAGSNCVIDDSYYVRLPLAKRWLDETEDDFVPSILEAASRCIHCRFAFKSPTASWDDEEFRRSVFDGVVKPLWDNCSSNAV